MTTNKTKAARGAIPAASTNSCNDTSTSKIKRHIVTLAVWGVLPMRLAEWLINHGGLRHE